MGYKMESGRWPIAIHSNVPAVSKHWSCTVRSGGSRLSGFPVDSAMFSALWASVVLLQPLLDSVFGENVAARGDASVFVGDIIE